ncbi:aspartate/glutamate racemase family protein [Mucilaginibacter sp. HC2]|uniref:aspartate/glutamate racemase family protein n=1 Tax=Mucilaginibacter inviolabilis TaxID=2714892 RepID=UPI00140A5877|nr:aspartate/glutamate racemase family protein [Mucilaginibacter inviolabilis]NHA03694.1 aspartate/glutamate racemase family protein [Mucilaginibacter inviolabilis]
MKILGLIGGMSYVSTLDYYRMINQGVNEQLGGSNFAECIIHSFNFVSMIRHFEERQWDVVLHKVANVARSLKASGAEAILICANTPHVIADQLQETIQLPVIHIARETAMEIKANGLNKVGLLGTKPTMDLPFFKDILNNDNIEVIVPEPDEREYIHQSVFGELGKGIFTEQAKSKYLEIIERLIENGAQGIILGCTEIPLLINNKDVALPLFNTTQIHARAGVKFALSL